MKEEKNENKIDKIMIEKENNKNPETLAAVHTHTQVF